MNVLITSGGTTEQIDTVRGISNFATGRLGAKIADEFALAEKATKIFYLCAQGAARPNSDSTKIKVITFTDVASLEKAIDKLLSRQKIDLVIHSAAIGDFKITEVRGFDGALLNRTGKIRSDIAGMTVKLEPAPKIIRKFENTTLIGFKLLSGVDLPELFTAADKLLKNNDCAFVVANRLEDIDGENHKAYLVSSNGVVAEFGTKSEIAKGLVAL